MSKKYSNPTTIIYSKHPFSSRWSKTSRKEADGFFIGLMKVVLIFLILVMSVLSLLKQISL